MRNILVTGGAGYIGSHTCKELASSGFQPIVIDNLSFGHRRFVKWGPLVEYPTSEIRRWSPRQYATTARRGSSISPPSPRSVSRSRAHEDTMRIMWSGHCRYWRRCAKPDLRRSSFQAPARSTDRPKRRQFVSEHGLHQSIHTAAPNWFAREFLADYAGAYGVEPLILRYFNAGGADPSSEIGEQRRSETHLIPRAMMALLGHIQDFEVFGGDFPTCDGTAVRDYIHVNDLAEAHVLALRHLLANGEPGTFNLGAGEGYSVRQVLAMIAEVTRRSLKAPTGARRQGDPPELVADTTLARAVLGFIPRRSDLRTIVRSAWQWHIVAHPLVAI